jgi:hypothetical protein
VRCLLTGPRWRSWRRLLCGRCSRAEGFTRLALMATLPGVPLYKAFGFTEVGTVDLPMPDGVVLGGVAMERPIDLEEQA